MNHLTTSRLATAALLLASCATPAPSIDLEKPPGQPRANPIALLVADGIDGDIEVRDQIYVELDGQWPAELAFIAGEPDEDPYADSDASLYVYGFDASGHATRRHTRGTWARSLMPTRVDPESGRQALVLRGGVPESPGALDAILELHDGALRNATWVTTPSDALLAIDEEGQGAHELLVFNDVMRDHPSVHVLARDPADGFWKARAPITPTHQWVQAAWTAYTAQEFGGDALFILPALLHAARSANVTLTLNPERSAQARDILMASPDPRERYAFLYALLATGGDADTLRDAFTPEHGLEVAVLWHAFALDADNTEARRDALIAVLESGLDTVWVDDRRDLRHAHRLTDVITRAFAAAGDGRLLAYLRTRPNTRRTLAMLFAPAWHGDAMLEDMAARAPSAPQARAVLLSIGGHDEAWAGAVTSIFATPKRRKQLDAWLTMNDARLLNSVCHAYEVANASDSPCTEERILAAIEATVMKQGDVTASQHLLDHLPAAPTTPDARARYSTLATHARLDPFARHALGTRLLGEDEVAARVDLILAMEPNGWCDAVDTSVRAQVEAMDSDRRKTFFTYAVDSLESDDDALELALLSCFDGIEEATQAHTSAQKDAVFTRALNAHGRLDPFMLLRWDPDSYATLANVYLDACVKRLGTSANIPSPQQCEYILEVTPFFHDEARSRRLDALMLEIESAPPEEGHDCATWSTAATLSLMHWDAHTQAFLTRARPESFEAECHSQDEPLTREALDALALTTNHPGPRRKGLLEWARTHPDVSVRTEAID